MLAEGIAAAAPNTAFATAVPEAGGVVVTFVEGTVYPTFEEVRPDLEKEAADAADEAGTSVIDDVRTKLGVTVNPRFEDPKNVRRRGRHPRGRRGEHRDGHPGRHPGRVGPARGRRGD